MVQYTKPLSLRGEIDNNRYRKKKHPSTSYNKKLSEYKKINLEDSSNVTRRISSHKDRQAIK